MLHACFCPMATSSPSSASSFGRQIKYDVFLSFRGKNIRFGFLSHLSKALSRSGIDAYIDERLERGDEISLALLRAIEESLISLVIFSKDYAASKWCLEELLKIIECMKTCGQIVLPVFYNIDPSDVRHQTGSFRTAFTRHEKRYKNNMDKVQNWRIALEKAANLSGFHSIQYGSEAELIEEIVERLLLRLNSMYQSDLKGLYGIYEQVAHIESLLSSECRDVRIIGIWGMGGIGKTTIASVLYNKLCFDYDSCCFLANVREESEKWGLAHLHSKLISILLKKNDVYIPMPHVGSANIMRRLCRKKVLVVLDDVDDFEQLRYLAGGHDWFGPGSRIIVTTRNKHVISKEVDDIYEVNPLNFSEALQLFNLNAFKQDSFELEYIDLSTRIVKYAKGIPLALKVMGSFLYGKTREEWDSELEKLKKMPHIEIQNALRLSYEGLDREERNVFLFIACFFKGEAQEEIKLLLDACGYSTTIALRNLQDKALIYVFENCVKMHDLIQEMGWEVVREESFEDPGKRSRLWDSVDVYKVLKNNSGTEAIQSLTLDMANSKELHLSPQSFDRMLRLKFLKFHSKFSLDEPSRVYLPPGGLHSLPSELRLLHWDEYPLKSLPGKFCAENLVELKMHMGRAEKLWEGAQNLVNLREVDLLLSEHLVELPDFSKALNLRSVNLIGCSRLRHVHPSIFSLPQLAQLHLRSCTELKSLQSDIHLSSLEELTADGCSSLKEFSVTSKKMTKLYLGYTAIDDLPSSILHLDKLEWLQIPFCESLRNLPNNFLQGLELAGKRRFDTSSLFTDCAALQSLKQLKLDDKVTKLPENISLMSSLQDLILTGCDIESLPTSIKHLSQLRYIDLNLCQRLRSVPELPPSIECLDARNCRSLERISSSTAEPLKQHKSCLLFENCVNLDAHAVDNIMADTLVRIRQATFKYMSQMAIEDEEDEDINDKVHMSVFLPTNKVPNWFNHCTAHDTMTIQIPRNSKYVAFIFCLALPPFGTIGMESIQEIGCRCYSKTSKGEKFPFESYFSNGDNWYEISEIQHIVDHVYIWYDEEYCLEIHDKANDQCTSNYIEVLFEFFVETRGELDIPIKASGVHSIYAPVLSSDDQRISEVKSCEELDDETESSTLEIEDGSSGCNQEEQEPLPKMPKFSFPPLQPGTWKQREGLKEILTLFRMTA